MSTVRDYNLAAVQVVLGSFRVTGFSSDDAASVVPNADLMEGAVSADGSHIAISHNNDNSRQCTLTVRRGTAAYKLIAAEMQSQIDSAKTGAVPDLPFSIYDPISGDRIAEQRIRFMREPDMTFARTTSDAVFQLFLPDPDITYGNNITTN